MKRAGVVATLAAGMAIALSGCGTVQNLLPDSPQEIYGGVRYDFQAGTQRLMDRDGGHGGLPGWLITRLIGSYIVGIDLPLSAAADTLTLPATARSVEKEPAEENQSPGYACVLDYALRLESLLIGDAAYHLLPQPGFWTNPVECQPDEPVGKGLAGKPDKP